MPCGPASVVGPAFQPVSVFLVSSLQFPVLQCLWDRLSRHGASPAETSRSSSPRHRPRAYEIKVLYRHAPGDLGMVPVLRAGHKGQEGRLAPDRSTAGKSASLRGAARVSPCASVPIITSSEHCIDRGSWESGDERLLAVSWSDAYRRNGSGVLGRRSKPDSSQQQEIEVPFEVNYEID